MHHARRPDYPVAGGAKMRHLWSLVSSDRGREMYGVELYAAVRLAVVEEGLSHREAGRRFGIDRRTVKKMLRYSAPPGYRRTAPVRRPKLEGFTGIIDAILEADRDVPRKQRHTAQRIFERLRDEHGFTGGATIVKDYARARRQSTREAFVPLYHPPGHAQVDFGEAVVELRGRREKVAFFCLILPHSNVWFVKAYPRETTEAFLDGHVSAFALLGGVPRSILYDNTTLAVARILGDGKRQRTRAFSHLQSHHLFRDRFGRPGKGNDKGKVEALVKTARRRFFVPIPKLRDLDVLNERLMARCLERLDALDAGGQAATLLAELEALRDLPARSLRGLRAHARPGLLDGPGALPAGGLLGAGGARPQEGDDQGLCRPGRDRARRRDHRPPSALLCPWRRHLRSAALPVAAGEEAGRPGPGSAAARMEARSRLRCAAPSPRSALRPARQARVHPGAAPAGGLPGTPGDGGQCAMR